MKTVISRSEKRYRGDFNVSEAFISIELDVAPDTLDEKVKEAYARARSLVEAALLTSEQPVVTNTNVKANSRTDDPFDKHLADRRKELNRPEMPVVPVTEAVNKTENGQSLPDEETRKAMVAAKRADIDKYLKTTDAPPPNAPIKTADKIDPMDYTMKVKFKGDKAEMVRVGDLTGDDCRMFLKRWETITEGRAFDMITKHKPFVLLRLEALGESATPPTFKDKVAGDFARETAGSLHTTATLDQFASECLGTDQTWENLTEEQAEVMFKENWVNKFIKGEHK